MTLAIQNIYSDYIELFGGFHRSFYETNEVVNYQTLSPKSLANSVLSEGGWSKLLVIYMNEDTLFIFTETYGFCICPPLICIKQYSLFTLHLCLSVLQVWWSAPSGFCTYFYWEQGIWAHIIIRKNVCTLLSFFMTAISSQYYLYYKFSFLQLKSSYLSKRPYANQDLIDFVEVSCCEVFYTVADNWSSFKFFAFQR